MKTVRFLLTSALATLLSLTFANPPKTPTPAVKKTQTPKAQEPITLEFGNMKSEKPKLMNLAKHLKSSETTKSTPEYAGQYFEMLQLVSRIGINNLTTDEVKQVRAIAEPSDEAIAAFKKARQQSQQSVNQQVIETDAAAAQQQRQKALEAAPPANQQRPAQSQQPQTETTATQMQ